MVSTRPSGFRLVHGRQQDITVNINICTCKDTQLQKRIYMHMRTHQRIKNPHNSHKEHGLNLENFVRHSCGRHRQMKWPVSRVTLSISLKYLHL